MSELLPGVLWDDVPAEGRREVATARPLAIAMIQVIHDMWPGSGSSFVREQIRVIWGARFTNHGGMCGLISRLLANPDDYPARHRAEVARLRPQAAKLIRSKFKAPLRVAAEIANE